MGQSQYKKRIKFSSVFRQFCVLEHHLILEFSNAQNPVFPPMKVLIITGDEYIRQLMGPVYLFVLGRGQLLLQNDIVNFAFRFKSIALQS